MLESFMSFLLRIVLRVILFFLLLGAVIGLASSETGPLEKVVLVGIIGLLLWCVALVQRLGTRSAKPQSD